MWTLLIVGVLVSAAACATRSGRLRETVRRDLCGMLDDDPAGIEHRRRMQALIAMGEPAVARCWRWRRLVTTRRASRTF